MDVRQRAPGKDYEGFRWQGTGPIVVNGRAAWAKAQDDQNSPGYAAPVSSGPCASNGL